MGRNSKPLNEDCYFYYYSKCKYGNTCKYRHCEAALGNETVCKNWLKKRCEDLLCPRRHMIIKKDRANEECYWETQPEGCQRPYCPFRHTISPVYESDQNVVVPATRKKFEKTKIKPEALPKQEICKSVATQGRNQEEKKIEQHVGLPMHVVIPAYQCLICSLNGLCCNPANVSKTCNAHGCPDNARAITHVERKSEGATPKKRQQRRRSASRTKKHPLQSENSVVCQVKVGLETK